MLEAEEVAEDVREVEEAWRVLEDVLRVLNGFPVDRAVAEDVLTVDREDDVVNEDPREVVDELLTAAAALLVAKKAQSQRLNLIFKRDSRERA